MNRNTTTLSIALGMDIALLLSPIHIPFLLAFLLGFFALALSYPQLLFLQVIETFALCLKIGQYILGIFTSILPLKLSIFLTIFIFLNYSFSAISLTKTFSVIIRRRYPSWATYMSTLRGKVT